MNLNHALRLTPIPCLALVGAGGKTTALFQLARELEPPVIVTATAHLATSQTPWLTSTPLSRPFPIWILSNGRSRMG